MAGHHDEGLRRLRCSLHRPREEASNFDGAVVGVDVHEGGGAQGLLLLEIDDRVKVGIFSPSKDFKPCLKLLKIVKWSVR